MLTKMTCRSLPAMLLAVAIWALSDQSASAQSFGPNPGLKSFAGQVVLTRNGLNFPYWWDIRFGKPVQYTVGGYYGQFEAVITGVRQTGWYTYDDHWQITAMHFNNPFRSSACLRPFPGSIYNAEAVAVYSFSDNQGNKLKSTAVLLRYR